MIAIRSSGRIAAGRHLRESLPLDAIQAQVDTVPAPLAEAEQGLLHVDWLACDLHGRAQPVKVRLIGPPELGVLPLRGEIEQLLLAGRDRKLPGRRHLDPPGLVVHRFAEQFARDGLRRRISQGHFQSKFLADHRRLGEDISRIERAGRYELRRAEDARLLLAPYGINQALPAAGEEGCQGTLNVRRSLSGSLGSASRPYQMSLMPTQISLTCPGLMPLVTSICTRASGFLSKPQ